MTGPAQWKKLTWDWAKFINSQLPYLSLCEKYQQAEYLTKYYTHFPKPSSHLWQLYGYTWTGAILVAQERGMIRPK